MIKQGTSAPYDIRVHGHRFAAWAASRAASVSTCRFSVEQGRTILEESGFDAGICQPEQLPGPEDIDANHRRWRAAVIVVAERKGRHFTHGIAAKLINVYLKSRFVCGGHHDHPRVRVLHPPIDSVLLAALARKDCGGLSKEWRRAVLTRWSKFDSEDYERVINCIGKALSGESLWMIEEHWTGNR